MVRYEDWLTPNLQLTGAICSPRVQCSSSAIVSVSRVSVAHLSGLMEIWAAYTRLSSLWNALTYVLGGAKTWFITGSAMASGINIYSQLLISTIRIVDINNWCRSLEANQTLHDLWSSRELVHYTYIFGAFAPDGILPRAKFTLRPRIAFSYIGSATARHSSSGCQPNFAAWYREWNYGTFA